MLHIVFLFQLEIGKGCEPFTEKQLHIYSRYIF